MSNVLAQLILLASTLAAVAVAVSGVWQALQLETNGSGGIGAVSTGCAEMLVMFALVAGINGLLHRAARHGRRHARGFAWTHLLVSLLPIAVTPVMLLAFDLPRLLRPLTLLPPLFFATQIFFGGAALAFLVGSPFPNGASPPNPESRRK
jgi:hypothetical protein